MKKAEAYHEFMVSEPLRPFIECVWFGTSSPALEHFIIPDNTVELIFTTEKIHRLHCDGSKEESVASHLAGLKTAPQFVRLSTIQMAAVRFKPGGLYPFVRSDMSQIINASVPLSDLFAGQIAELEEEILLDLDQDADLELIVHKIDRFFCAQLKRGQLEPMVDALMHSIEQTNGNLSVGNFAQENGLSLKTLERRFKQRIGLPPKRYAGMYRFHQSVLSMEATVMKLSDIAYDNGYFDQMHYIKEARRYTGRTPKQLLELKSGLQRPTLCKRVFPEIISSSLWENGTAHLPELSHVKGLRHIRA